MIDDADWRNWQYREAQMKRIRQRLAETAGDPAADQ